MNAITATSSATARIPRITATDPADGSPGYDRSAACARDTISHELRTPLTVIKMGLQFLQHADRTSNRLEVDPARESMRRAVNRLERLVVAVEQAIETIQDDPVGSELTSHLTGLLSQGTVANESPSAWMH